MTTKPVTSLRNYTKVIDELVEGDPVILTKNGTDVAVLVNSDEWNRQQAEIRLLTELTRAERNFGKGYTAKELLDEFDLGGARGDV